MTDLWHLAKVMVAVVATAGVLVFVPGLTPGPAVAAEIADGSFQLRMQTPECRPDGLWVFLGLPADGREAAVLAAAKDGTRLVYVQCADEGEAQALREAAGKEGLLGSRVFVGTGPWMPVQLADNYADRVFAAPSAGGVTREEVLRVLRPEGKGVLGKEELVKPFAQGNDDWGHVHHGPDNNPVSNDRNALAPYRSQFFALPLFGVRPTVTVASGGRVFRAFGHAPQKIFSTPLTNTLLATDGCNGMILWRRKLGEDFMIRRSSMIATPDTLFLADSKSCKLLDARTGEAKGEISPPGDLAGGTVWKWMALENGVLYAMVGAEEPAAKATPSTAPGWGAWAWGWGDGLNQQYNLDPKRGKPGWGFGKDLFAIDPRTGKVLWHHREEDLVDNRGICMRGGRIYLFSPGRSLGCIAAGDGKPVWRNSSPEFLAAVWPPSEKKISHWTEPYIQCSDDAVFFAGNGQSKFVAVSAKDGSLLWTREPGCVASLLYEDAIYAIGADGGGKKGIESAKLDYKTGKPLGPLPSRCGCTIPTGSRDGIFYRHNLPIGGNNGGTDRINLRTGAAEYLPLMRPGCMDGVTVSDGMLYWGPWICSCGQSLFGTICLGPAGAFDAHRWKADESKQLFLAAGDRTQVRSADAPADWPAWRADNRRSATTSATVPPAVALKWTFEPPAPVAISGPVVAGGLVLTGGADGAVRAASAADGKPAWKFYTGGSVNQPPAYWKGRAYAASNDGHVYALEAATGRLLWRFRLGPEVRRINVYGDLMSTWPAAGGLMVAEDSAKPPAGAGQATVYAAGGIAHHDGTHVYALDAVTGRIRWHNGSSGLTDKALQMGISLQGPLSVENPGSIRLGGGHGFRNVEYKTGTGEVGFQLASGGVGGLHPWNYSHPLPHGQYGHGLTTNRKGRLELTVAGGQESKKLGDECIISFAPKDAPGGAKWEKKGFRLYAAVFAENAVIMAGACSSWYGDDKDFRIEAHNPGDGKLLWSQALPAAPATHGLAVARDGSVFASLADGRVLCFGEK